MKKSQFNSLIQFDKNKILYNSLHNRIVVLNDLSDKTIELLNNNIENIKSTNSELYYKLIDKHFIIDTNVDELSFFKSKYNDISKESDSYHLTINPTMGCTFKCWYCYEEHLAGSKLNQNILNRVKLLLSNLLCKGNLLRKFYLSFFGGEPLLYYKEVCYPIIESWFKYIEQHQITPILGFTTNGYLVNDFIIDHLKKHAKYTHFQITLDGYKDDHDKVRYISSQKGSYNQIVNNIKKLAKADFNINLRINYTPENLNNCSKILSDFDDLDDSKRQNIKVSFHCVWQETSRMGNRYMDVMKIQQSFAHSGFLVNTNMALTHVTNMCYADRFNSAVINYNGDVFKCTARSFDIPKREGILDDSGNIIWDQEKIDRRMTNKLKNKPCQTCRILPQCFGGCSQNQIESTQDYCIYNFDQKKIDLLIVNHIKRFLEKKRINNEI